MMVALWYTGEPDSDDFELIRAKEEEIIPPRCQLGGRIVLQEHALGNDPCSICPQPLAKRRECGGRDPANTPSSVAPTRFEDVGAAKAREAYRREQVAEIARLLDVAWEPPPK